MESLKQTTANGIIWSSIERFSVQGIQFVFQIILSRLLSPTDYGVIAMLAIFMAISQSLIDAGFTHALIRKSDRTEIDYSTVFYLNILLSVIIYVILFISAPAISRFYRTPLLIDVTRAYSLVLIINALGAIQKTIYAINIDFKSLAKASLIAALISGLIGVYFAAKGLGAWALVYSAIGNSAITTLLMWMRSAWRPKYAFSMVSLRHMFAFGSKLMLAGLLNTLYANLQQMVIGRKFSKQDLGYYARADQFAQFPSSNITGIFQRVTYPVLCKLSDNDDSLLSAYRKFIRFSAYIIFPLMLGLAAIAKPFIAVLLGDKWLFAGTILQIICLSYMWYPIHSINLNVLQVKGRSDLFFRVEIVKKVVGISILLVTMQISVIAMAVGTICSSLIALVINTYYTKKLLNYGLIRQLKDLYDIIALSIISCIPSFIISLEFSPTVLSLSISIILAIAIYLILSKIFKLDEFSELIDIAKRRIARQ
jgi:teichuronic acid exporter